MANFWKVNVMQGDVFINVTVQNKLVDNKFITGKLLEFYVNNSCIRACKAKAAIL